MIHRLALPLLLRGALGCARPPQVEPRHPPASLLSEAWEVPGPVRADVRGFRPECAALIPYTVQPPIVQPKAVEMVLPTLDPWARRTMRLTGTVILEAVLDESGRVCDARLLKRLIPTLPPQRFDEPIREALLRSRFEPATFGNVPVAVVVRFTVRLEI